MRIADSGDTPMVRAVDGLTEQVGPGTVGHLLRD